MLGEKKAIQPPLNEKAVGYSHTETNIVTEKMKTIISMVVPVYCDIGNEPIVLCQ